MINGRRPKDCKKRKYLLIDCIIRDLLNRYNLQPITLSGLTNGLRNLIKLN